MASRGIGIFMSLLLCRRGSANLKRPAKRREGRDGRKPLKEQPQRAKDVLWNACNTIRRARFAFFALYGQIFQIIAK